MSFENLLLHDDSRTKLELLARQPKHAIMLVGPLGTGKTTVAKELAKNLLKIENLESYPYFLHLSKNDKAKEIGIDDVRQMIRKLNLRTTGKEAIKRIVLIEDAHTLSPEGQNSLLKILEEPPADTVFILTVPFERTVLPTILSRTYSLHVLPVSMDAAISFYSGRFSESAVKKAWQLSQGYVGLTQALLTDDGEHPLRQAIENAKAFLRKNQYERLLFLDEINNQKPDFEVFLNALEKIIIALQHGAIHKNDKNQQKILQSRKLVYSLKEALTDNVSPRLISLELATELSI
jgi:replication-associated recombination protein RarA